MKTIAVLFLGVVASVLAVPAAEPAPAPLTVAIANEHIDFARYLTIAHGADVVREPRRLTEDDFAAAMRVPGTVLLDARSADKYRERHLAGAVSLPFTDFTADALARVIPTTTTRVLIYCNNNFAGDDRAFPSKAAPASLNISTYIALVTYGYENVWELGPYLDVATSTLRWAGTNVGT